MRCACLQVVAEPQCQHGGSVQQPRRGRRGWHSQKAPESKYEDPGSIPKTFYMYVYLYMGSPHTHTGSIHASVPQVIGRWDNEDL